MSADAQSDDEWRKRVTSVLREAPAIVVLDNVTTTLDSGALAALLTSEFWSDRILGSSRLVTFPNRTLWIVTGNNISMSGELTPPHRADASAQRRAARPAAPSVSRPSRGWNRPCPPVRSAERTCVRLRPLEQ